MIIAYKITGEFVGIYKNQSEAGRQTNTDIGNINHVINGKLSKTNDLTFLEIDSVSNEMIKGIGEIVMEFFRDNLSFKRYFNLVRNTCRLEPEESYPQ